MLNHTINPLLRRLLRSPLHRPLSGSLLLLTYQGRQSGRRFSLPVMYLREDQMLSIIPAHPEQKVWWRNLRGGAPVRVHLRGKRLSGRAEVIAGKDQPAAVADVLGRYLRRFPRAAGALHVSDAGDRAALEQAAQAAVLVRVTLTPPAQ